MGKALADAFQSARDVFTEVDEALGQDLSKLMWAGDIEELTLTANTQPALMAHSVAAARALESEFGLSAKDAAYVAGHSLGEYSALAAAGSIGLSDTAKLLRIRGNAMQAAVQPGEGAMAALLGADIDQAEAACAAGRETGGRVTSPMTMHPDSWSFLAGRTRWKRPALMRKTMASKKRCC